MRRPSGYQGPRLTTSNYRLELTTGSNSDSRLETGQVFVNIKGDRGQTGERGWKYLRQRNWSGTML